MTKATSRVVLAGSNYAAILTLDLILEAAGAKDVLAIAPKGGRHHPWQPSLEEYAVSRGVPCLTPEDVNETSVIERVRKHRPTLFLSVYYTQVFWPTLLESVECPVLNFHPSLLPRHRGTAPLIWAIAEGDRETGLTLHHVDEGIDTGPIVAQHRMAIHRNDSGYILHQKMARLVRATAAKLLVARLRGEVVRAGVAQVAPGSYHGRGDPPLNHLNWSEPRERIRNIVRALAPPLPGAYALLGDEQLVLGRVEPLEVGAPTMRPPGMVELRRGAEPIVWAADGPVRIVTFLADGRILGGNELPRARGLDHGQVLA
jgi:methionyl-tRNA formyltransferase